MGSEHLGVGASYAPEVDRQAAGGRGGAGEPVGVPADLERVVEGSGRQWRLARQA